jgi:multidrug efflux system membrane fusion protein
MLTLFQFRMIRALARIHLYRTSFTLVLCSLISINALAEDDKNRPNANLPIPVVASTAQQRPMPVWIDAQGTVTPRNYVNVMPRVAGLLQSISFQEGQTVKAGQLLAKIDPRPFQIQLDLAVAALAKDKAQLDGAKSDLERYETLLKQDSIAEQQVVDQRATVSQLIGTVASDKANKDNAVLQLEWTRIVAPISGVVGLRQVDVGNMVGTGGVIGGGISSLAGGTVSASVPIVTLAQVQPITVTFALPQNQLPTVLERLHGTEIPVQAWDQRRVALLDSGKVAAVDNQINTATGTIMIKAEFTNSKLTLYPNQFVNVRMLVNTIENSIVIPSAAIASGGHGNYVYVIGNEDQVSLRTVTTGVVNKDFTAVTAGLTLGERVVIDGLDRLKDGSKVQVIVPSDGATSEPSGSSHHGKGGKPDGGANRKQAQ